MTLISRLWRAIRLGPRNGRCSASVATAGECVDELRMLTLEAQLRGQQNIAQSLAELPGAITTVLNRAQAPTRRMLVDQKGVGKPSFVLGQRRRLLRVGQEGRELRIRCVPERAWSFDVCSGVTRRGHSRQHLRLVCQNSELRLSAEIDVPALRGVVSPHRR